MATTVNSIFLIQQHNQFEASSHDVPENYTSTPLVDPYYVKEGSRPLSDTIPALKFHHNWNYSNLKSRTANFWDFSARIKDDFEFEIYLNYTMVV